MTRACSTHEDEYNISVGKPEEIIIGRLDMEGTIIL
jgi:hypothetical protein